MIGLQTCSIVDYAVSGTRKKTTVQTMKIFEFTWPKGDTEWYCANNPQEAKEVYANEIGEYIEDIPDPKEMTDEEAKQCYILDIDDYHDEVPEGENEEDFIEGYRITSTLYDSARKMKTPGPLATTEF